MTDYAFEGEVVKLNIKDFTKWQCMYPSLDLTAELIQIDEEFAIRLREGEKMKKWFSECYARLNGRNKIASKNNRQFQPIANNSGIRTTREISIHEQLTDRSWAKDIKLN